MIFRSEYLPVPPKRPQIRTMKKGIFYNISFFHIINFPNLQSFATVSISNKIINIQSFTIIYFGMITYIIIQHGTYHTKGT
jgi:hypothetical protein